jgi:hypothetical protein
MRTFLVKNKKPIVKWGGFPQNTFFYGEIPDNCSLGVSPSKGYVVIDVDRHGTKNGFDHVPDYILKELEQSFNYPTKNNGHHYWVKYTGDRVLGNKTSNLGIDLRTEKGYVVWYPKTITPQEAMKKVKESSVALNFWLMDLFSYKVDMKICE